MEIRGLGYFIGVVRQANDGTRDPSFSAVTPCG